MMTVVVGYVELVAVEVDEYDDDDEICSRSSTCWAKVATTRRSTRPRKLEPWEPARSLTPFL